MFSRFSGINQHSKSENDPLKMYFLYIKRFCFSSQHWQCEFTTPSPKETRYVGPHHCPHQRSRPFQAAVDRWWSQNLKAAMTIAPKMPLFPGRFQPVTTKFSLPFCLDLVVCVTFLWLFCFKRWNFRWVQQTIFFVEFIYNPLHSCRWSKINE